MNRYDRNIRSYRRIRRGQPLFEGKVFLIVTEGEQTEPQYLEALRRRLGLIATRVVVAQAKGTDPMTLVREAVRLREQRRRAARRPDGEALAFDEVWCVLDSEGREDAPALRAAAELARGENIRLALSRPCFEFWLLLHAAYTTAAFANCAAVTQRLWAHYPDYAKNAIQAEVFIPATPLAVTHARRVRADHQLTGAVSPATDMDLLACELNRSSRPHLRLAIDEA